MIEINVVQIHLDGQLYETKIDDGATLEQAADSIYDQVNELSKLKVGLLDGGWLVLNKTALQRCHFHFTTSLVNEADDVRIRAMRWWNERSSAQKTKICDLNTDLVGSVRRWETLTGREIEMLYKKPGVKESV